MQQKRNYFLPAILLTCTVFILISFLPGPSVATNSLQFPYKNAGLSKRQAAAHLLNRFTYGATPTAVDLVEKMGLENWFQSQLNGKLSDLELDQKLRDYDLIQMSNTEIAQTFPRPAKVLKMAIEEGAVSKDSVKLIDKEAYKKNLSAYYKKKNIRLQSEFLRQWVGQKIIRATYSNNQLQEVLTGFWFNHFNVSFTKKQSMLLIPSYERDAIRPHVLGNFEDLLIATATSPAMLTFLDNFNSSAQKDSSSIAAAEKRLKRLNQQETNGEDSFANKRLNRIKAAQKNQGLNENYAREVMELHTMGVEGGYTQNDVTDAARVLTGWTINPLDGEQAPYLKKVLQESTPQQLNANGIIREGDFLFAGNRHDKNEKTVLNKKFAANGGYQEGLDLLHLLAEHPSTATFISRKLATYFVSDNPPISLIKKMAATFTQSKGDIKSVLITMVQSPEFWSKESVRQKTKSPFEFVISTIRVLDAQIENPFPLFLQMDKMGQKIYHFQAPTGFPDRADFWINTGSLLNRMNFGMEIAAQKIRGTKVDILQINNYHEPENPKEALITYASLLMPERDMAATVNRLVPLLTNPSLNMKLQNELTKVDSVNALQRKRSMTNSTDEEMTGTFLFSEKDSYNKEIDELKDMSMLSQVVGIIIGSPEFQRK